MTLKGTILTAVFGAMFLFAGVGTAQAHDNCSERINKEENKLQREIRKHGFFSHQAQNRREKLSRLRRECGYSFWGRDRNGRWGRNDRDRDDRWGRDRDDRWGRNDRDRDDRRDRDGRWNRDGRGNDRDRDNDRRRDNNWYWDGHQWRRR